VRTIIQNNKDPKGNTEVQISPLVDKRTYRTEENHESSKKKIPKNKRQCRTKTQKKSDIPCSKIKIRSDNKNKKPNHGKNTAI